MGRAKLKMERINKEKTRNLTFKKRKEGLTKKLHELTTLCDVSACMLIYGPRQENGASSEPEIWPQDRNQVHRMIDIYKNADSGTIKTYSLADFFQDRERKIEDELDKLRKKNKELKYPTRLDDYLNNLPVQQLMEFSVGLSNKAEQVKSRIDLLKRSQHELMVRNGYNNNYSGNPAAQGGMIMRPGVEWEFMNRVQQQKQQCAMSNTVDHHQTGFNNYVDQNSMMMLLTNGKDDGSQFGGGSMINMSQNGYYETKMVPAEPMMYPMAQYYAPNLPVLQDPMSTNYMSMVSGVGPSPMKSNAMMSRDHQGYNRHLYGDGDINQVNMKADQYMMMNRSRFNNY